MDSVVFHNPLLRDGFAQVPNAVMRDSRLSPQAKCVYTLLLTYAWKDSSCFPSQKTIAEDLCISDRYIRTILKELSQTGFLKIEQQGLNRPNIYHFLDFYADSAERNNGSTPDRNSGSGQERKGSSGQGRNNSSSEQIPTKEYAKKNTQQGSYGIYTRAMGKWIESYLQDHGKTPKPEKIQEIYEKMKKGERLY